MLLVVVVALAAYGAVSALRLRRVDHQLRAGTSAAQSVRGQLTTTALQEGRPQGALAAAHADFAAAATTMSSSWWAPLRWVPILGRQLTSVRDLSVAAATTTDAGRRATTAVQVLLAAPHDTAAERTALIGRLAGITGDLQGRLARVDLGPADGLIGTIHDKRATFVTDLAQLRSGLARATAATAATARLLTGPSTYLVLAANNAEMRAGSGMFLEAGAVTFDHGAVSVSGFSPAAALSADQPEVPVPAAFAARWGSDHPGQEWRNLGLSPQFPLSATTAARMWAARGGGHVDGVIALDVPGLADLLGVTGPVTAGPVTYTAADVTDQLLVREYDGLTGDAAANDARRQALGALAGAALHALQGSGASVSGLVDALDRAANGRHLMVWAADPATEARWQTAGVGGALPADGVLLALLNQGGNKLDPFQHLRATLSTRADGADTAVTVTATLTDAAPASLSPYAGDGIPGPRLAYRGALALDLPAYAGHITSRGGTGVEAAGPDGATSDVVAVDVLVPAGGSTTVTWHWVLLGRHGALDVQPSARVPATSWSGPGGTSFEDDTAHLVRW